MVSETLTKELESYRIGSRVRALRLKKKLSLAQLASHTGLSTAMLSKIERGQVFPTLPTLLRIAMVFGVGLDHFFNQDADRPLAKVVRADERMRLSTPPGSDPPAYRFESLDYPVADRRMESFYAEFPAESRPTEPHEHGSAEFVYVLAGELQVTVGEEPILLGKGDALYFDSSVPHSYCRRGSGICSAIVVTAP
jgi:transcriptional regulator with XRE-family HTH domain